MQGCFECTLWDVFDAQDINEQVVAVSDYICFCVDSVIPTKTYKVYSNDKPWVSGKLKNLSKRKKKAYQNQVEFARRDIQRQIKRQIQLDKLSYKQKLEVSLASGNSEEAWKGIKNMTSIPHKGRGNPSFTLNGNDGKEMANQLNSFFCCFESSESAEAFIMTDFPSSISIEETEVLKLFKGCNIRKKPGPDHIGGDVLKYCAEQLTPVFTGIF